VWDAAHSRDDTVINPHCNALRPTRQSHVSVVIRCYNEEKHIGRLMEGLLRQSLCDIEIIVVDSGSTDATLAIVARYPAACIRLTKEEFSFGRSLNLGCSAASGDIIVVVSAHCYPVYPDWLEQLTQPFVEPKVAISYGKQRGNHLTKFSEHQIYRQWFGEVSDSSQQHPFSNNANAAFRRAVWSTLPFDETLTGLEDLDWARKVMRNGYRVAYVAEAEVVHVHEETWRQIYNRYRREAIAMRHILPQERFTLLDLLRLCTAGIARDVRAAWAAGKMRHEASGILLFRLSQYLGTFHGYRQRDSISQNLRETFYYPGDKRRPEPPIPRTASASRPISYLDRPSGSNGTLKASDRLHDISMTVTSAPVWPGETRPKLDRVKSFAAGDGVEVSELSMCVHTGTHVDAPWHFVNGGTSIGEVGLARFIGPAQVIDVQGTNRIDVAELETAGILAGCKRLLLRTSNSRFSREPDFDKNYAALTPASAQWLRDRGIGLVGIDYASIEAFDEPDNLTHKILLEAGVVVLEGLDLSRIPAGCYELVCLPLKIGDAEAAPARAVLIESVIAE